MISSKFWRIQSWLVCPVYFSRAGVAVLVFAEKKSVILWVGSTTDEFPTKILYQKKKIGFWIFCQWIYRRNIYLPEAITIIARFKLPEARRTHARQCANDERAGRTVCKITDHVCPAIDPLYGIFVILRYIEWPLQKKENERRSVFKFQVHHRRELKLQSTQTHWIWGFNWIAINALNLNLDNFDMSTLYHHPGKGRKGSLTDRAILQVAESQARHRSLDIS